jgi:hypothetical protein
VRQNLQGWPDNDWVPRPDVPAVVRGKAESLLVAGSSGRAEQTMVCFLPGGMEIALLVNSPVGAPTVSLQNLVLQAVLDNLVPIFELVTPERHIDFGRTRVSEESHAFPVLAHP